MTSPTIVLGVIGMDVHAVGNRILEYTFTRAGFRVINLGVMVSQEEFVNAAIEFAADVIIVSSLYGHGELDCRGLRAKCITAGVGKILLYVGGNLVVGKASFTDVEKTFRQMGFDRIYPPGTPPELAMLDLRRDLGLDDPVFQVEKKQ